MPAQLQATVIGQLKIKGALDHLPVVMRPLFERVSQYGQWRMKRHAKSSPAATGVLAEGVGYDIRGTAGNPYRMEAHIGFVGRGHGMRSSLGALAPTVNYGRRPGKPPAVLAIRTWLRRYPLHISPRDVQRRIGERGTRGTYMLEKTVDDLQKALPEIVRKTEREIEAAWPRGS